MFKNNVLCLCVVSQCVNIFIFFTVLFKDKFLIFIKSILLVICYEFSLS